MQLQRHAVFWIAAALMLAFAVHILAPVLLPFAVGLVLAYFLNPVVDGLSALGLPRLVSTALLLLLATVVLIAAFVLLLPVIAEQTQQLISALPQAAARLRALIEEIARERLGPRFPEAVAALNRSMSNMSDTLPGVVTSIAQSVWSHGTAAFSFLSLMLVTPLVTFYALLDWPKMLAKIDSWLPRENAQTIRMLASDIDQRVSAFIRGQGLVCLILAAFYALCLSALGLQYGLLVGLLTGLFSFVPFAGWALGLVTATVLAVVQFWPDLTSILMVAGVFFLGQVFDAGLLSPQIVGSKIGLHPVWLIFALLVFSYLFGFLGLLVAVPVAAAIGVLVRFSLNMYLTSGVYHGHAPVKL
jgi:predicted PurR-regulated permease PerM